MTTTERRTWTWPTWPTWPTWSRWLPWLPALLLVAAAVAPLVLYWLGNVDDQRLVDLDVYRTGGEAVLEGRSVYGFVTAAPQLLPFTYPPVAALLATPLAAVSWPAAQWAWTALIFLTLAVTVGFSFRAVLGGRTPRFRAPYRPRRARRARCPPRRGPFPVRLPETRHGRACHRRARVPGHAGWAAWRGCAGWTGCGRRCCSPS